MPHAFTQTYSLQVLSGTAALVFSFENIRFGKWFSQYIDSNADSNVIKILIAPLNK
jgi:hypothetical protein